MVEPTGRTWCSGGDSGIEFRSVPFSIPESSSGTRPGNTWIRFVEGISVCSIFHPRIGAGGRVWTMLGGLPGMRSRSVPFLIPERDHPTSPETGDSVADSRTRIMVDGP